MASCRRWCFTLNNYSEDDCEKLNGLDVKSIIVGKEKGEQGTEHLQGFVKFEKAKRLSAVKKILDKAHWEKAKGSDSANLDYCSKENVFLKKGVFASGSKGGGASGLKLALSVMDKPFVDMTEDEQCAYLRHEKFVERKKQLLEDANFKKEMKVYFESATLRKWQQELLEYVEQPADKRKVRWYVDEKGNSGKTWMASYLRNMKNAMVFSNAKTADIAYAYKSEDIVIFDFSRSQETIINYNVIEQLKNGYVFSPKYESCSKAFKVPHVICFSNFVPNRSTLSADRWDIHVIKEMNKTM